MLRLMLLKLSHTHAFMNDEHAALLSVLLMYVSFGSCIFKGSTDNRIRHRIGPLYFIVI